MGTFKLKNETVTVAWQETALVATKTRQYIYNTTTAMENDDVYLEYIQSHPDVGTSMGLNGGIATNSTLVCTSIQVNVVADSSRLVYTVDTQGSTFVPASAGGATPFLGYTANVSGTYVDVWRAVAPPASGTATNTDIAGTKLDSGGKPISMLVVQSNVQVTRKVSNVPWGTIWGAVGKRNSDQYDGAAVGQLLFTGISVNTIGLGLYEISYQYLSDSLLHCRQLPILEEADGRTMNLSNQAKDVRWVQPHPTLIAFSGVFTGA